MTHRVSIAPRAERDLAALTPQDRRRVGRKIEGQAVDPRPPGCRKLPGSEDAYRIRVGDLRILYEVRDDVLIVLVIMVRHRSRVYDDIRRLLR